MSLSHATKSYHVNRPLEVCETTIGRLRIDPTRLRTDGLRNDSLAKRPTFVLMVLLDLSGAFDTVDHDILITRLKHRFGITGKALGWIQSSLCERSQFVRLGLGLGLPNLICGVPPGSVLGPILYSIYTSPLTDIISKHNMNHHVSADDSQIYVSFKPSAAGEPTTSKHRI